MVPLSIMYLMDTSNDFKFFLWLKPIVINNNLL
jgi:hypothetical protein